MRSIITSTIETVSASLDAIKLPGKVSLWIYHSVPFVYANIHAIIAGSSNVRRKGCWGSGHWCRNIGYEFVYVWWSRTSATKMWESLIALVSLNQSTDWLAENIRCRVWSWNQNSSCTGGVNCNTFWYNLCNTEVFQQAAQSFLAGIGANIGGGSRRMPELCGINLEVTPQNPTRGFRYGWSHLSLDIAHHELIQVWLSTQWWVT